MSNFNLKQNLDILKTAVRNYEINAEIIKIFKDELVNHFPDTEKDRDIIQAVWLLAQMYDQKGQFLSAKNLIKNWAKHYDTEFVEWQGVKLQEDFLLTKQKVWVCLTYSYLLYRDEKYREALEILKRCQYIIEYQLLDENDKDRRLFGTRAFFAYITCLINYQNGDFDEAAYHSKNALKFTLKRARNKIDEILEKKSPDEKEIKQEQIIAEISIAKIEGFCKAAMLRSKGKLSRSLGLLEQAQYDINNTSDELILKHILSLKTVFTRQYLSGGDEIEQQRTLNILNRALKGLESADFQYSFKGLLRKGEILIDLVDTYNYKHRNCLDKTSEKAKKCCDEADKYLSEAKEVSKSIRNKIEKVEKKEGEEKNWRWRLHILDALICFSEAIVEAMKDERGSLKNQEKYLQKGLKESDLALEYTKRIKLKKGEVRALISKGKALFRLAHLEENKDEKIEKYKAAEEVLKDAIKESGHYGVNQLFCNLFLAKIYLRLYKIDDSTNSSKLEFLKKGFQHWSKFEGKNIEYRSLKIIADYAKEQEFKELDDLFLLPKITKNDLKLDDFSIDTTKYQDELKAWLYKQAVLLLKAESKGGEAITNDRIAKKLGYSSHTTITSFSGKKRGRPFKKR